MNDRSVYYALTIVGGLMKFLFSCGYLWVNPVPNFKAPPRATFSPRSRSISTGHKRYVLEAVALDLNETPAKKLTQARNRWIVQVLLHSAMRINELATHTFDDFRAIETAKGTVQTLAVSGKGGKQRLIPIPHELVVERERFLAAWRKAGWPGSVNNLPLAPTVKNVGKDGWIYSELYAPLSTRQIDRLLKTVMDDAGERAIMNSDPHAAQTLQKVSAHWLRHTRLRELADSTSDLRVVQAVAGHSDINTSAGYSAKGLEDLAEAMGLDDT
jgi:site-specific recombinase XerD